jgi:uncharacterized protein (UPF0332 family)
MSTPGKEEIINIKIQKAEDTLLSAKKLLEDGFLHGAVNRIYYACYYTSTALLYHIEVYTKSHTGVQQMLSLHFIKNGILDKSHGQFYSLLFSSRQAADYDDFIEIDEDEIKEMYASAVHFIESCKKLLGQ